MWINSRRWRSEGFYMMPGRDPVHKLSLPLDTVIKFDKKKNNSKKPARLLTKNQGVRMGMDTKKSLKPKNSRIMNQSRPASNIFKKKRDASLKTSNNKRNETYHSQPIVMKYQGSDARDRIEFMRRRKVHEFSSGFRRPSNDGGMHFDTSERLVTSLCVPRAISNRIGTSLQRSNTDRNFEFSTLSSYPSGFSSSRETDLYVTSPRTSHRRTESSIVPRRNSQNSQLMVTNLHPNVSERDVFELFSAIGQLKSVRLSFPGIAYLDYVLMMHARQAHRSYHRRKLDGQEMIISLRSDLQ